MVFGAEGTARLGLTLERLLAGLDTLGVKRTTAFEVVQRIAYDSVPPQRALAYDYLRHACVGMRATTTQVAEALDLPSNTARYRLEELAAYQVVRRISRGGDDGRSDLWLTGPMGRPPNA